MKKLFAIALVLLVGDQLRAQDSLPRVKVWSLSDCLNYAVANNITIKKSKLDYDIAAANAQQAKYNKLPSLSANGSGNVSNGFSIDPITSDFVNQTIISNSYNVNGQLVIYQGSKLNLEISKNDYMVKQSSLYQKQAENSITLSVLETYLQTLYYYEGIQMSQNTLASSAEELRLTKAKFDNGAIAKKDLADIETQYAQNKYNLVNSQTLYAQQVLKLKQLLELPPEYDFEVENVKLPELNAEIPDKYSVFASAAGVLPDVQIYETQSQILKKQFDITKAAARPTLSLGAGLNTGYTNTMSYAYYTQLFRNFSQQASLSLSIPIFSKFQNKTNIKVAKLNIDQNELDKTSASKTLYANVETAWLNAVNNKAQQESAKTARDNAQLAYQLAAKKYEFGGLTTTELAVSRSTYLNTEQTYIQVKYMSVLYRQLLNFYQGKSFDQL